MALGTTRSESRQISRQQRRNPKNSRAVAALAERRARGEIMTDVRDGWVFREYPRRRVKRICLLEDYRAIAHEATVIDNSDIEKRILLGAEHGVILELDPSPPRWFKSRRPEIQRAPATHTGGAG